MPALIDDLRAALRTVPDFPKPGIQFKDITPILSDPALLSRTLNGLVAPVAHTAISHVVGIESRGFLFGAMLAERLQAGFVPVRKPGKLPAETLRKEYALEYGTDAIEMHADALRPGDRVLIHDDVLATGGTAAAATALVQEAGAEVVGYSFVLALTFLEGQAKLPSELPCHVLIDV